MLSSAFKGILGSGVCALVFTLTPFLFPTETIALSSAGTGEVGPAVDLDG